MWPASKQRWILVAAAAALAFSACATPAVPSATPTGSPSGGKPPLAADLAGGTPVSLGGEGHWAIWESRAFTATAEGVEAIDLTTGSTAWQASFPPGSRAWDALPTLGISADGVTVHALRTVDTENGAALELLSVDAATGKVADSRLVADGAGQWRVDLPPRVLHADAGSLVLADDPESGAQVGVVGLPAAELAWRADDQGFAADAAVVTRSGARDRLTGSQLWRAAFQLGPLVGRTPETVVAEDGEGHRLVWLDAASGEERASVDAEPESCVAAASVVACTGDATAGYDLSSGAPLWSQGAAQAVTSYRDWVYLWRSEARGDVLDARTGTVLVSDAELPRIRFANDDGVIVAGADGESWVSIG